MATAPALASTSVFSVAGRWVLTAAGERSREGLRARCAALPPPISEPLAHALEALGGWRGHDLALAQTEETATVATGRGGAAAGAGLTLVTDGRPRVVALPAAVGGGGDSSASSPRRFTVRAVADPQGSALEVEVALDDAGGSGATLVVVWLLTERTTLYQTLDVVLPPAGTGGDGARRRISAAATWERLESDAERSAALESQAVLLRIARHLDAVRRLEEHGTALPLELPPPPAALAGTALRGGSGGGRLLPLLPEGGDGNGDDGAGDSDDDDGGSVAGAAARSPAARVAAPAGALPPSPSVRPLSPPVLTGGGFDGGTGGDDLPPQPPTHSEAEAEHMRAPGSPSAPSPKPASQPAAPPAAAATVTVVAAPSPAPPPPQPLRPPPPPPPPPVDWSGTWLTDRSTSDSLEPFLKLLGLGYITRKLLLNVEVTSVWRHDVPGGTIAVTDKSIVTNSVTHVLSGETRAVTDPANGKVTTLSAAVLPLDKLPPHVTQALAPLAGTPDAPLGALRLTSVLPDGMCSSQDYRVLTHRGRVMRQFIRHERDGQAVPLQLTLTNSEWTPSSAQDVPPPAPHVLLPAEPVADPLVEAPVARPIATDAPMEAVVAAAVAAPPTPPKPLPPLAGAPATSALSPAPAVKKQRLYADVNTGLTPTAASSSGGARTGLGAESAASALTSASSVAFADDASSPASKRGAAAAAAAVSLPPSVRPPLPPSAPSFFRRRDAPSPGGLGTSSAQAAALLHAGHHQQRGSRASSASFSSAGGSEYRYDAALGATSGSFAAGFASTRLRGGFRATRGGDAGTATTNGVDVALLFDPFCPDPFFVSLCDRWQVDGSASDSLDALWKSLGMGWLRRQRLRVAAAQRTAAPGGGGGGAAGGGGGSSVITIGHSQGGFLLRDQSLWGYDRAPLPLLDGGAWVPCTSRPPVAVPPGYAGPPPRARRVTQPEGLGDAGPLWLGPAPVTVRGAGGVTVGGTADSGAAGLPLDATLPRAAGGAGGSGDGDEPPPQLFAHEEVLFSDIAKAGATPSDAVAGTSFASLPVAPSAFARCCVRLEIVALPTAAQGPPASKRRAGASAPLLPPDAPGVGVLQIDFTLLRRCTLQQTLRHVASDGVTVLASACRVLRRVETPTQKALRDRLEAARLKHCVALLTARRAAADALAAQYQAQLRAQLAASAASRTAVPASSRKAAVAAPPSPPVSSPPRQSKEATQPPQPPASLSAAVVAEAAALQSAPPTPGTPPAPAVAGSRLPPQTGHQHSALLPAESVVSLSLSTPSTTRPPSPAPAAPLPPPVPAVDAEDAPQPPEVSAATAAGAVHTTRAGPLELPPPLAAATAESAAILPGDDVSEAPVSAEPPALVSLSPALPSPRGLSLLGPSPAPSALSASTIDGDGVDAARATHVTGSSSDSFPQASSSPVPPPPPPSLHEPAAAPAPSAVAVPHAPPPLPGGGDDDNASVLSTSSKLSLRRSAVHTAKVGPGSARKAAPGSAAKGGKAATTKPTPETPSRAPAVASPTATPSRSAAVPAAAAVVAAAALPLPALQEVLDTVDIDE